MDTGHGHVQGGLLLCLQSEVGKVVGVGVDAVPQLLVAPDRDHQHGHPFVTEQSLVPLERLTPGSVGVGIAGDPIGDLAQAERARRIEEHQQQVGNSLESVEALHRGQSRARRARG